MDMVMISRIFSALSKLKNPLVLYVGSSLVALGIALFTYFHHEHKEMRMMAHQVDKDGEMLIFHGAEIKDLQDESKNHVNRLSFNHYIDHTDAFRQEQTNFNLHTQEEIGDFKESMEKQFLSINDRLGALDEKTNNNLSKDNK